MDITDPARLLAANHELGHAVGFRVAGIEIREIRVKGTGASAWGWVRVPDPADLTGEALAGFLAAGLAGAEATRWWLAENPGQCREWLSADDLDSVRRLRRTPAGRQIPLADIAAAARRIVRTHWGLITRLTPVLAQTGRLAPHRLAIT